jgi:hypothetical protein
LPHEGRHQATVKTLSLIVNRAKFRRFTQFWTT